MAHLLIIEDEPALAKAAAVFCEYSGHTADIATTGADALAMLGANHYDVVITDLRMPAMDGVEVAEAIRSDPRNQDVPIVAIAGSWHPDQRVAMSKLGVTIQLMKPYTQDSFINAIEAVLSSDPPAG